MWNYTSNISILIFNFIPIIWNLQQNKPNDHLPLPFQYPNLSLIESDLGHTPQGYCTHWNHWISTFSDFSSIPCPHLAEKKASDYVSIPLGYCSGSPVSNISNTISSVSCDRIASKHTENYWEFAEFLFGLNQCSCSKLDYQNGSIIKSYSEEREGSIQVKKKKIFKLSAAQTQIIQIGETQSWETLLYTAFGISCICCASFFLGLKHWEKQIICSSIGEKLKEQNENCTNGKTQRNQIEDDEKITRECERKWA